VFSRGVLGFSISGIDGLRGAEGEDDERDRHG
jgi:hypothetical protein